MTMTQNERLFRSALDRASLPFGKQGFHALGRTLRHALVLAEITRTIAAQDSEAAGAAMVSLAEYAVLKLAEEEF